MNGVGIYFSRRVKNALLNWKAVSDRIITARLNSRWNKITIIQCYTPTEDSELEIKEQFYSMLDKTLSQVNRNDLVILMEDFNARIGADNTGAQNELSWRGRKE